MTQGFWDKRLNFTTDDVKSSDTPILTSWWCHQNYKNYYVSLWKPRCFEALLHPQGMRLVKIDDNERKRTLFELLENLPEKSNIFSLL